MASRCLARTTGPDAAAITAIRDAAHAIALAVPLASLATMKEKLELPMWPRRTAAGFFLICGMLALLLATVGLFGVTDFTVRQRTREFGIPDCAGRAPRRRHQADPARRRPARTAVRYRARPGRSPSSPAASSPEACSASAPRNPLSFGATAVIEIAVALLACALPARRATQADPMIALRDDN